MTRGSTICATPCNVLQHARGEFANIPITTTYGFSGGLVAQGRSHQTQASTPRWINLGNGQNRHVRHNKPQRNANFFLQILNKRIDLPVVSKHLMPLMFLPDR